MRPGGHILDSIVAEITNTPWLERHAYVLPVSTAIPKPPLLEWRFAKAFHVSPFMAMEHGLLLALQYPRRKS